MDRVTHVAAGIGLVRNLRKGQLRNGYELLTNTLELLQVHRLCGVLGWHCWILGNAAAKSEAV
jgi:hypothetical protein